MTRGDPGVVEPGDLGQAQAAHDGLGRLVEHGGHGPDLRQAGAVEGDPDSGLRGLGGVAVMPGGPGQPPAHLQAAGAGHAVGHRIEAGEADERAGRGHLQRPQAVAALVEARLDAVDHRVAGRPVEGGREEAHGLGVAVKGGKGLAVRVFPAPHEQPAGLDAVESCRHVSQVIGVGHFRSQTHTMVFVPSSRTGSCLVTRSGRGMTLTGTTGASRTTRPPGAVTRVISPRTAAIQVRMLPSTSYCWPNGRLETTASTDSSGRSMLRASPWITPARGTFRRAISTASASMSLPWTSGQPAARAAPRIAPAPQHGSSRTSRGSPARPTISAATV